MGKATPKRSAQGEDGYQRESGVRPVLEASSLMGLQTKKEEKDRNEVRKAETREGGDGEDRSNDSIANRYTDRHRRRSDDAGHTVHLVAECRVRR